MFSNLSKCSSSFSYCPPTNSSSPSLLLVSQSLLASFYFLSVSACLFLYHLLSSLYSFVRCLYTPPWFSPFIFLSELITPVTIFFKKASTLVRLKRVIFLDFVVWYFSPLSFQFSLHLLFCIRISYFPCIWPLGLIHLEILIFRPRKILNMFQYFLQNIYIPIFCHDYWKYSKQDCCFLWASIDYCLKLIYDVFFLLSHFSFPDPWFSILFYHPRFLLSLASVSSNYFPGFAFKVSVVSKTYRIVHLINLNFII